MNNIRATTVDIQSKESNKLDLYSRQSEVSAQAITYTIIIVTVAAAGITSVLVYAINRDIHTRHLTVQRSLQTEVENRTEQLQIANEHCPPFRYSNAYAPSLFDLVLRLQPQAGQDFLHRCSDK